MARVTLQTIADALGVSRTTVSNAYNRPDQLAPGLRERILATAGELGYAGPDPVARRLRSGTHDAVGLLSAGLSHAFADPAAALVLRGIARAVEDAGLALLAVPDHGTGVHDVAVRAFCICALPAGHPSVRAALARRVPLVAVDEPRLAGHAYVGSDGRRGALLAAEHLLALGHRRIAVLADRARHRERIAGYRDAGISFAEGGRLSLTGPSRPTAVLAATDQLALDALEAARRAGLRVPDELSVVGFDDVPAAAPAGLTTIREPLREKGEIAGRLLVAPGGERVRILPVELVVRGSTAPA